MCQRVITTRLTGQLFVVQQLYIHSFKAFALQKVTDNEQTFKGRFCVGARFIFAAKKRMSKPFIERRMSDFDWLLTIT